MFNENNLRAPSTETEPDNKIELIPEEIGKLTIEEVFKKLDIRVPAKEEITDFKTYMDVQTEVMKKLSDTFHDEQLAIEVYQKMLAEKFNIKYRQGF